MFRLLLLLCLTGGLTGCLPSTYPELEPWPDLIDLRDGLYMPGDVDFELPWALPLEEIARQHPEGRQEVVHACLLLPLTGARAEEGRDALKAALLAAEVRAEQPATERRVRWHVEDTMGQRNEAVSAAERCIGRQALLLAGPLLDRQVNEIVPAMAGRGVAVMVPEPGAANLERWDERFVAVGPPAHVMGRILAEHAASQGPPGIAAALVPAEGIGPATADRWMEHLAAQGWTRGPVLPLPANDPGPWPDALRKVAAAGATAVLIGGGVPPAAALLPVLKDEAPDLRLWMIDASSQVEFVHQAAHAGLLDHIHFTLRRWPARDFRRAFAQRWGHRPLHASASVYDAIVLGHAAGETAGFLTGPDMGGAARRFTGTSAWGDPARTDDAPRDHCAAAGYDVAVAVQGSPESGGIWTFVPVEDLGEATP